MDANAAVVSAIQPGVGCYLKNSHLSTRGGGGGGMMRLLDEYLPFPPCSQYLEIAGLIPVTGISLSAIISINITNMSILLLSKIIETKNTQEAAGAFKMTLNLTEKFKQVEAQKWFIASA